MRNKSKILVYLPVVLLLSLFPISCRNGEKSDASLETFREQKPVWKAWEPSANYEQYAGLLEMLGDRVTYTTIQVPRDYNNPLDGSVEIALLKVKATEPSKRRGSILINPGGPGEDGLPYSLFFGYLWSEHNPNATQGAGALFTEIAKYYDLVGFSPRGTGSSTELTCSSENILTPASKIVTDDSTANIQNNLENARLKAEVLLSNPLTPYINSDSTARDMDIIRQVLGDEELNYLGISYGTWLGTWYMGLFPDRVGRMLLIGNTNITTRLNDTLLFQEMGMQRVMDQILVPYAAANNQLFRLGDTEEKVRQVYLSLKGTLLDVVVEALHKHIAESVSADTTLFTLHAANVLRQLLEDPNLRDIETLDSELNAYAWEILPEHQLQVIQIAHELGSSYFEKKENPTSKVEMDELDSVGWAVQCNDAGTSYDEQSWGLQSSLNAQIYPLFGGDDIENLCLYWPKPTIHRPPVRSIRKAGNILMVQSQYDPYTVLDGAMKTFSTLPNASMIVLHGEYQHFLVFPYGKDDVDALVADYLLKGDLPQSSLTQLPGKPLPTFESAQDSNNE